MRLRNPKKMIFIALAIVAAAVIAVKKGWIKNPFNRG